MKKLKDVRILLLLLLVLFISGCVTFVTITSPRDGDIFKAGAVIVFSGEATDVLFGTLPDEVLVWTSDRDGEIGKGKTFTKTNLSAGVHTINLSSTKAGSTGSASIKITVDAEGGSTTSTTIPSTTSAPVTTTTAISSSTTAILNSTTAIVTTTTTTASGGHGGHPSTTAASSTSTSTGAATTSTAAVTTTPGPGVFGDGVDIHLHRANANAKVVSFGVPVPPGVAH